MVNQYESFINNSGDKDPVVQLVGVLPYKPEGRVFDFLRPHYCRRVNSLSTEMNTMVSSPEEYKWPVCTAYLATFMCRLSNSGSLNFLQPQGHVQACIGIVYLYHIHLNKCWTEVTSPYNTLDLIYIYIMYI
jgi:hypothetical protein